MINYLISKKFGKNKALFDRIFIIDKLMSNRIFPVINK